jgi:Zn-dependent peptidase ImmA (M78 family)
MQSFFHKIAELKCGWNEQPLDEAKFHKICRKHKIRVKLLPLTVHGFYSCTGGKHYIAVDSRLPELQKLFVMFHEFGHFLMHSPSTDFIENYCGSKRKSRDEQEADAFAYCALLPLSVLKNHDPEELLGDDGVPTAFLMERLRIYERYGI